MYLLIDRLQPGDIILTFQKSLVSKSVRIATKSKYSHAILYVGDGSYIHSDKNGVHSGNIQRLLLENLKSARVLRTKNLGAAKLACDFARSQIGTSYSVKEAVKTKFHLSKIGKNNRQFCSRLVAQSYEYAGFPLVINAKYCTPQELEDSPLTYAVKNCLRKATLEEIEFVKSENPLDRQAQITNFILNEARALTGSDIQSLNQLMEYLLSNRHYDNQITEIVVRSGYLTMWQHELDKNKWRYDAETFMDLPIPTDEKLSLATRELEHGTNLHERFKSNLEQYFYIKETTGLRYAHVSFNLYKNLVEQTIDRITAAKYVLENA